MDGHVAVGRPTVSVVLFVKFLHIAAMFCAVGVSVGTDLMAHRIAGTGDVRSIRTFFAQSRRLVMLMPVLFLTGLALGLLTAWSGALNLFAPWLIIAYILFALTLGLHATIGARAGSAGWTSSRSRHRTTARPVSCSRPRTRRVRATSPGTRSP
jgi:hypothetical protein